MPVLLFASAGYGEDRPAVRDGAFCMKSLPVILLSTVLTLSALYVPQPLLPVLAKQFSVSRELAALLTTIVFIPLSLAPLVYGYLLEAVPAKRILRIAMLLLGLSSLALAFVDSYSWMLGGRLFQGLLIPALLTALMTYTSQSAAQGDMQRAMAWYIGATIAGGIRRAGHFRGHCQPVPLARQFSGPRGQHPGSFGSGWQNFRIRAACACSVRVSD